MFFDIWLARFWHGVHIQINSDPGVCMQTSIFEARHKYAKRLFCNGIYAINALKCEFLFQKFCSLHFMFEPL